MPLKANDKQIGGQHYKKGGEEHWDRIYRLYGRGYFVGNITKYAERYHEKNGKEDLEKVIHYAQKLIELEYPATTNPEYAPLPSFPQVKSTGWVNFVFEGATAEWNLFTCRTCRKEVRVHGDADPGSIHTCDGPRV